MATDNKQMAENAEALMLAEMNKKREPAHPEPLPRKPVTGTIDAGARAERSSPRGTTM